MKCHYTLCDLCRNAAFFVLMFFINACVPKNEKGITTSDTVSVPDSSITEDSGEQAQQMPILTATDFTHIDTKNILPDELVTYAETLIGIPYKYASVNPAEGFDCSGFITYVFNHFNIAVPRSSVDFTNMQTEILLTNCKRGDLILFTGTDSTIRIVGHMGIITSNSNGEIKFIHSTSGKAKGVVITPFEKYYTSRFVKAIRVFNSNNQQ